MSFVKWTGLMHSFSAFCISVVTASSLIGGAVLRIMGSVVLQLYIIRGLYVIVQNQFLFPESTAVLQFAVSLFVVYC